MTLKTNILATYASQIYVTLVGIVVVPLYLRYMGAEAYGLVGFFAMLQAWFNLLDLGLTPTVARETARFRGGALDAVGYRQFVRALQGIFLVVAVVGGAVLCACAPLIGANWLRAEHLPTAQVNLALQLMGLAVALRWMCGLYRGVISGSERLVWLSAFNAAIATLRFVCVLPLLMYVNATPEAFFGYQLGVAVLELGGLMLLARRLLPQLPAGQRLVWHWAPLKPMLKFSLTIAFTSSVWVLVTQTDKLLLSKILPLADYGYFSVAVLVASGISILGGPISSAILPRMSRLQAEGKEAELIALYRQATRMVAVVTAPAALVLACFPAQVLWAWTGNAELVTKSAPVLTLYAVGYGILAVSAFPYYLQYAKGNLRLHLIGNIGFVGLLIPSVVWAATHFGMTGAGWAWLVSNAVYLLLWTPLVHRHFAPGMHFSWLLADIASPACLPIAAATLFAQFMPWSDGRIALALELAVTGAALLLMAYPLAGRIRILNRGIRCAS